MLYYYRADEEVAAGTLRTLLEADRSIVAAGIRLTSVGTGGRIFSLEGRNRLEIAGDLVSSDIAIIAVAASGSTIRILESGSISGGGFGVYALADGESLYNAGSIAGNYAAFYLGEGARIVNDGQIFGDTSGVAIGALGSLTNTGSILATAPFGSAVSVNGFGASVVNSGLIVGGRVGVDRELNGATGDGPKSLRLVNTGTIEGGMAAVIGHDEADSVTNSGTLVGHVLLGGGGDEYDGTGGTVAGLVSGGDGDDLLIGGSARDRLLGGEGADTLWGAGGNDVLDGGPGDDEIDGGEGDDFMFGGPGFDRYDGGAGRDTVSFRNSGGCSSIWRTVFSASATRWAMSI